MPTTNLISKSLGDTLLQSGNGSPDHSGTTGNMFLDITRGEIDTLSNIYASTGITQTWGSIGESLSACITSINSNTTITTSATATWYTLSSSTYNWSTLYANGFSVTDGRITCTGLTGNYYVNLAVTLKSIGLADLTKYRIGVSKNGLVPDVGYYASTTYPSNASAAAYIGFNANGILNLTSGDTLEVGINAPLVVSTTVNLSGITFTVEYMD